MELDKIIDDDLDKFFSHISTNVTKSMNKHAPIRKIVKEVKDKKPWYNDELRQLKLMLRYRENIWKKYKEDHLWLAYKIAHNKYTSAQSRMKTRFMMLCNAGYVMFQLSWG